MESVDKVLAGIGLHRFEVKIYLYLLSKGEQPASVVSKSLKIPRSTSRGILDRLCERGFVEKVYKKNTQYYLCKPPEYLVGYLERSIEKSKSSIEKVKEQMPLLSSYFEKSSIAPKVRVFEGPDQVIEAFNLSLFEEGVEEILIFTSYEFLKNPLIRKNDDDFYIKQRVKRGIQARVLVGKTNESSKLVKVAPKELRERRFIPDKYQLPGNIHIYSDYVLYFSTIDDEYIAVLVEGAMMANTMKTLFEFMWDNVG